MLTEEDVIIRKILDRTDYVGEDLRSVNVYIKTIRVPGMKEKAILKLMIMVIWLDLGWNI